LKWSRLKFGDAAPEAAHVGVGSKADIALGPRHVRFTPESGHPPIISAPGSTISKAERERSRGGAPLRD
jgi:hypothetical protein